MTFKTLFNNEFIILFKKLQSKLFHYLYILHYTKYYSKNKKNSYRLDIKTNLDNITITCLCNEKSCPSKIKNDIVRYYLKRGQNHSIHIKTTSESSTINLKYIPRFPYNLFLFIIILVPVFYIVFRIYKNIYPLLPVKK